MSDEASIACLTANQLKVRELHFNFVRLHSATQAKHYSSLQPGGGAGPPPSPLRARRCLSNCAELQMFLLFVSRPVIHLLPVCVFVGVCHFLLCRWDDWCVFHIVCFHMSTILWKPSLPSPLQNEVICRVH